MNLEEDGESMNKNVKTLSKPSLLVAASNPPSHQLLIVTHIDVG
jgi:hypothetical protein